MGVPAIEIVTQPGAMDLDRVHGWLARDTYWGQGMTRETFDRAVAGSLPFAGLAAGETVGFTRVVTDRATFAYITDMFVARSWRGRGVGRALVRAIVAHPDLQGLRRTLLVTRDAHALYAGEGFEPVATLERFMERRDPGGAGSG